jgi:DNA-binding response OmpR family regulator
VAHVLVVEDDADAADALAEVMRIEGHEVRIAGNGEQGFRLLTERKPDLLLLDLEMPILDGAGMANQILIHNAGLEKVPVVILSGSPEIRRVAADIGTPYFIGKPYEYEQLVALVEQVLRERRPPKPAVPR